jgi:hypothetical protein
MPNRAPRDLSDKVQWLNSSGEEVPAYGVVKLFSYDPETNQFQADKPDGGEGVYYANTNVSIPGNLYSASFMWNLPRRCLVEDEGYGVGEVVGPVSNKWGMSTSGSGFRILRPPNADKIAVVQKEGGGGGGAVNAFHGIVSESHGKGYYTVELAEWAGVTPDCEIDTCDPCKQMTGSTSMSTDDNCGEMTLPEFDRQTVGTGAFVLAYHRASVLVPLEVGSDCFMIDVGDSNSTLSASETSSASSGGDEPVYQIVDGYQKHLVKYEDTYDCCNTGEDILVSRKAIIFAAVECDVAICNPCTGG